MDVNSRTNAAVQQALSHEQGLSAAEQKMLASLEGPERARMEAQLALQKEQEALAFITKALKNDNAMQVINALK